MKEIFGDMWAYLSQPNALICITTNGAINKKGLAVMGRGCAKEATIRFPGIARNLAQQIEINGNVFQSIPPFKKLYSFPVKWSWEMDADLQLIYSSAMGLYEECSNNLDKVFILPRPGCGNGRLKWSDVKPVLEFLPDNVLVITYK